MAERAVRRHRVNRWERGVVPWGLWILAAGALSACGGGGPPAADAGREVALEASPVVLGGQNGLEVQYWVATGDGDAMAAAFGGMESGVSPLDEAARAVLEKNGLRVFVVPVDRLSEVQSRLSVIGAVQRQWLGQAPGWIDIATGPLRPGGQTIALHDGALRLGPGRLRLLLRGWTVPIPPSDVEGGEGGAAMDIEFVPQHQETDRRGDLALTPQRIAPEDEGLVFTRLAARVRLHGDVAVVIVPERPGAVWEARSDPPVPAAPPAEAAKGPAPRSAPGLGQVSRVDSERAPAPAPAEMGLAPAGPQEQGPPSAALPSLGEAMLMSRADLPRADGTASGSAGSRTIRAVVVLVPRVPERFELMGR